MFLKKKLFLNPDGFAERKTRKPVNMDTWIFYTADSRVLFPQMWKIGGKTDPYFFLRIPFSRTRTNPFALGKIL